MKKSTKKTAKPTMHVTITRKILGKAPKHYSFHLHDGRKVRSIYELVDELETMTEEAFKQYATDAENHFANWIEHVFEEKNLAEEMRKIRGRIDTQRTLLKHLVRELVKHKGGKK